MAQMQSAESAHADFADLFENPTIDRMLRELDPTEFEHFVEYVFQQAGYIVEYTAHQFGQGLDLKLFTGSAQARTVHAGVSVKQYQPTVRKVSAGEVNTLRGGLPTGDSVVGYVVTTSGFHAPALDQAVRDRRIWPIDGAHWLRYITYVRGSRAALGEDVEQETILRTNPLAPVPPEVFLVADAISRRPMYTTTVLTLANNKGGVGKTTSALNIAFGLAALDEQVLLVDMDAQANLTRALPPQAPSAASLHIGDYFTHKRHLAELIRPTQFKRVWLIPSDNVLTRSDMGIAAGPGAELRFVRDLHAAEIAPPHVLDTRPFDWIIIDTGPHMGLFTRSALAASHCVIMPVAPSVFADQGTDLLTTAVQTMEALADRPIAMLGCLVTQWRDDAVNRDLLAKFTARLEPSGLALFKTKVPFDKANIERAHVETGQGRRRNLFDRRCAAAQAYIDVVEQVMRRGQ